MKELHIDLETYCEKDLKESGVYVYASDPSFEILLFGYSFDDEDVKVVDIAQGEEIPSEVLNALTDPGVIKIAHNAMFERVCLSSYLGYSITNYLPPEQWKDSCSTSADMSVEGSNSLHIFISEFIHDCKTCHILSNTVRMSALWHNRNMAA